jgi:hypothetical protein
MTLSVAVSGAAFLSPPLVAMTTPTTIAAMAKSKPTAMMMMVLFLFHLERDGVVMLASMSFSFSNLSFVMNDIALLDFCFCFD